nr:YHYH protein [Granulosicoccus sp.]
NGIPDFPYIATSPGVPTANLVDYVIPATPTLAAELTAIPIVGSIGVAVNGIPIYGPTEGPGGDVLSRPGGFVECGGHNGPTGYHYHIFDVNGSDFCRFTENDVANGPVLFGYALDGYPIYSGNTEYTSSWYLEDASLFATDTWTAHVFAEGSGDLDQCNGRTDENGNYAYYTTEGFPYTLGCFRGVVELQMGGR